MGRFLVSGFLAALVAGPASASTISVSILSDVSSCQQGFNDGVTADGVCSTNGAGTFDDWGANWSAAGGTSSNLAGVGATSTGLTIDAAVAADDGGIDVGQGGDRWIRANVSYNIQLSVDVDAPSYVWSVDLVQGALGLYGLRGDGTLTAVGTQNNGAARASSIAVSVDGNPFNVTVLPTNLTTNPSNNGSASLQFAGNRNDLGILSGTGDGTYNVSISFNLQALSRDGCTGFICSSASGGEEAATLFGLGGVIDQAVDDYGTWGRAQGPDGYGSTWTLNVLEVPEPWTLALLVLGFVGLAARRRSSV
jgi:hypothetical protein